MRYHILHQNEFKNLVPTGTDFKVVMVDEDRFIGIDKDNYVIFGAKIFGTNINVQRIHTKKLDFEFNIPIKISTSGSQMSFRAFIARCKSDNENDKRVFLDLCEVMYGSIAMSEPVLFETINTLSDFFGKNRDISDNELQGLFAELYTIEHFLPIFDLRQFWQSSDKQKFDFSISERVKIEVKSTTLTERKHHFKHDQLISNLFDIYVVSVMLLKDDSGYSLYDLINNSIELYAGNQKQIQKLLKILYCVDQTRLQSLCYSSEYMRDKLRVFNSIIIPKFHDCDPDRVLNAEYDSILEGLDSITDEMLASILNKERNENV